MRYVKCRIGQSERIVTDWLADIGKRSIDNEAQEYAASNQCNEQGHRMGASAGTEGLHHLWAFQEGD